MFVKRTYVEAFEAVKVLKVAWLGSETTDGPLFSCTPAWLTSALDTSDLEIRNGTAGNACVALCEGDRCTLAMHGSYIVRSAAGKIEIFTGPDFEAYFEAV